MKLTRETTLCHRIVIMEKGKVQLKKEEISSLRVNKYILMKKVLFPLCLINVMLLLSCGVNKTENEQAENRAYDVSQKMGEENTEFNDHIILYDIPLEEIAKRIENEYVYENMIDHIAEWKQKELGLLPAGEDIKLVVYIAEGNYYFWPVGFGLNGSLEEGEMNSHYMNAVCIERTKQLKRSKIVIEVDSI